MSIPVLPDPAGGPVTVRVALYQLSAALEAASTAGTLGVRLTVVADADAVVLDARRTLDVRHSAAIQVTLPGTAELHLHITVSIADRLVDTAKVDLPVSAAPR